MSLLILVGDAILLSPAPLDVSRILRAVAARFRRAEPVRRVNARHRCAITLVTDVGRQPTCSQAGTVQGVALAPILVVAPPTALASRDGVPGSINETT
jgi:hypothetical protein